MSATRPLCKAGTPCAHFSPPRRICKFGARCFFKHGSDDTRAVCDACGENRCGRYRDGSDMPKCTSCATRTRRDIGRRARCRYHKGQFLTNIKGTQEMFCALCVNPRNLTVCEKNGCNQRTARNDGVCAQCYDDDSQFLMQMCGKCGWRSTPDEDHQCN